METLVYFLAFFAVVAALIGISGLVYRWMARQHFTPENAGVAINLVWKHYTVEDPKPSEPPAVSWIMTDAGWWIDLWGRKVAGSARSGYHALVAWHNGVTFSRTALAHELWHCYLIRRGGDTPDHIDPGFGPGGRVQTANEMLVAARL
jgi:hypothetical protein